MSDVIIIPSCHPVSFATTRGMFPDHFMRRPGARGGPCHSYRGFYLRSGPDMCRPRVPPRLNAGISEILPPNGRRWLASYRKSSFIVISPGFAPWPGIENGSDTATSWPPGPHPSPPLGTWEYFSNLEQNILTKWRKRVEERVKAPGSVRWIIYIRHLLNNFSPKHSFILKQQTSNWILFREGRRRKYCRDHRHPRYQQSQCLLSDFD